MKLKLLVSALVALTGLTPMAHAQISPASYAIPSITVSGNGMVSAAPDHAMIRLGAEDQGPNAGSAQQAVNKTVAAVIAAIKKLGIADKNIATIGINLYPVYSKPVPRGDNAKPEEPKIIAYRASNTVKVDTDDLEKIGPIIDAGLQAGANNIQGLDFDLQNDTKQREEALEMSAKEAKSKADAIARAMGITLIGVLEVSEGGISVIQPRMEMSRFAMKADYASTPVQAGQVQVQASLTVKYRIQQ